MPFPILRNFLTRFSSLLSRHLKTDKAMGDGQGACTQ
jgi:hypothetical protein